MPEHGFVEVDPAEVLDPLRRTEDLEPTQGLLQHAYVERAATEVVDEHPTTSIKVRFGGVLDRGRLWLRTGRRRTDFRKRDDLVEELTSIRSPVRRMRQHDLVGFGPAAFGGRRDNPGEQLRGQDLRR